MKKLRQLSEQIMGNISQFIEDAENNNSAIDKTVEVMKKQIQNAKKIVATAIADEQKLKRAYREAIDAANRCEHRMNTLLQNNNEQQASEVRQQGKKYQELAHDLEQRIHVQESFITDLKAELSEIYEQFRSTSSRAESLTLQQKQTKIRAEFHKLLSEFELIDANATLTEAEQQLKQTEAKARMWEDKRQQKDIPIGTTETDFNIDEALADLKREILGSSQND